MLRSLLNTIDAGSLTATTLLTLGLVAATGLALGSIRLLGVRLGVAGVLFSGLILGHFGLRSDAALLSFVSDLGLVLFVYSIGAQIGPGFLASLRRQGLTLNLLAVAIVLLGTGAAFLVFRLGKVELPVTLGILSGATTNTPSLAAVQQIFQSVQGPASVAATQPGTGYAVAYPFGVVGIILTMLLLRRVFQVRVSEEVENLQREEAREHPHLSTLSMRIENQNLDGVLLKDLPLLEQSGVVVSRIIQGERLAIATPETRLQLHDVLFTVGEASRLAEFCLFIGQKVEPDMSRYRSNVVISRLIVTQKRVLGRSLQALGFLQRFGVKVTRVGRAEVEFAPTSEIRLHYGDLLTAVGPPDALEKVGQEVGNSSRELSHPKLASMFLGIVLGILAGRVPFRIPGAPEPMRLGMAGGPLVVSILLSWIGQLGPVLFYLPIAGNFMLREVGIALFLACVGLRAGDSFFVSLAQGSGFLWMAWGALITLLPILVVGVVARRLLRLNYAVLCGVLAGSTTDPPALAFAIDQLGSEAPASAYATVYPLTMILRVVVMQALVLLLGR